MQEKNKNNQEVALLLKTIIDTAIDGIITIDHKGLIQSVNQAAIDLFGYEERELIGQNISMLTPSPHKEQHDGYIANYLQSKQPKIIGIGREVMAEKKDGSLFPIRLAVSEVQLQDRLLFTGIIHDLTEVKKAENSIKELNKELESKIQLRTIELDKTIKELQQVNDKLLSEIGERKKIEQALIQSQDELKNLLNKEKEVHEMKSRFLSIASHEFKTPLSTILSSTDLIEAYAKEEQLEKRERHILKIRTAVSNLNNILNDFLSLSKLEEKKVVHQPTNFLLSTAIQSAFDQMEPLLKKGQHLHFSNQTPNLYVYQDEHLLKNVLINLLSNAIKYSPEGTPVFCKTALLGDKIIIDVQDYGIGISEEDQKHLFTRFFRAQNTGNIQGTGLGLSIVKRYLKIMNADIELRTEENKGSTFSIYLPIAANE